MDWRAVVSYLRLVGVAGLLLTLSVPVRPVGAQPAQGATMTVIRGDVAVVHRDGSAIQPAPSGTTVFPGDEIRTLSRSGALITFFVGTEIELGQDTVLRVDNVSRQGDRIDVSLSQVFGAALHRVATFADPGSSYRVEAGGAVSLVRGTVFLVAWYPPIFILVVTEGQVGCSNPPGQALRTLSQGGYYTAAPGSGVPAQCAALESAAIDPQNPFGSAATILTEATKEEDRKRDGQDEDEQAPSSPDKSDDGDADSPDTDTDSPDQDSDSPDLDSPDFDTGPGGRAGTTLHSLAARLGEGLDPLTSTGALLVVGAVGWTVVGVRRRRR